MKDASTPKREKQRTMRVLYEQRGRFFGTPYSFLDRAGDYELSSRARCVYFGLLSLAGLEGQVPRVRASYTKIRRLSGVRSKEAISKALAELERGVFIRRITDSGRSNSYEILFD